MFNTQQLEQAKADFEVQRFCVIDNIIQEPWISDLYKCLPIMNMGYWMCAEGEHHKFSQSEVKTMDLAAYKSYHKDRSLQTFGYWHRAKWLLKEEDYIENDYPKTIEFSRVVCQDYSLGKPDTTFLDVVERVTGFPNMYTREPSYSAYDHESWLNPHHDPRRWCAYIFYFNPDWKAHWGGQLCLMNKDEQTIKHSIEPFGNRLVLMDVSDTTGHRQNKHFISPVSYLAPYPRYSLAGWFYPKDQDGIMPTSISNDGT